MILRKRFAWGGGLGSRGSRARGEDQDDTDAHLVITVVVVSCGIHDYALLVFVVWIVDCFTTFHHHILSPCFIVLLVVVL